MRGLGRFLRRIVFSLVLVGLIAAAISWWEKGGLAGWAGSDLVAVVWVEGAIEDATATVDDLEDIGENDSIKAVVLRVDSPGGGVAPSQEIYDAVVRLREKKPVVASLANVAASGGYYVAAACDAIVSNAGTLTGSIGVLMQVGNVEELMKKLGLSGEVLKAGRYKDIGSPIRTMTAEERGILQDMLADVHDQFVAAVAKGRNLPPADVRLVADGRVFSGAQAFELKLVDKLGGLREAVLLAGEKGGIEGEPKRVEFREGRSPWWLALVSSFLDAPGSAVRGLSWRYQGPLSPG